MSPESGVTLACESVPRGPALLVARWGDAVLSAVVAAVLELVETHARERAAEPASLHVSNGALRFGAQRLATPASPAHRGAEDLREPGERP